ncbi:MAG: UDP-N-acetylglucosamine 1-carboxyvinyltransferase [Acidobacteria bacterium]|nr:UDP-N-acetylglucosamine 1-carboxyvinyltransferase [Acidobacteriota bacterium]
MNETGGRIRIAGGKPLSGEVVISGAKNAALPALAATLLTANEVSLLNLPRVADVTTMLELISHLGVEIKEEKGVKIRAEKIESHQAPYELVKRMRASVLVLGPLLARTGRAIVAMPGGCAIGARPIDLHLTGLSRLGAEITVRHGYVEARAKRLRGAEYYFNTVTVTGTEHIMMAATLAKGKTILQNCAQEPEVVDLAHLLTKMGAKIEGAGTPTIIIEGVEELDGASHSIIPDRIEAGTYLIASAITGGGVKLKKVAPKHLTSLLDKLIEAGASLKIKGTEVELTGLEELKPVDVRTAPYPGFPTDMQAQWTSLMTQAEGTSIITETIFENRFMHISELMRMGANIRIEGRSAIVTGKTPLSGALVTATDLRASASLVIAGLVAEGETIVENIYHLERGYEDLVGKLRQLGAEIEKIG